MASGPSCPRRAIVTLLGIDRKVYGGPWQAQACAPVEISFCSLYIYILKIEFKFMYDSHRIGHVQRQAWQGGEQQMGSWCGVTRWSVALSDHVLMHARAVE